MNYFRYKQFNKDVITVAVGYYLRYALSYRDISEILRERGVNVHHSTVYRWVQEYAPILYQIWKKKHKKAYYKWRIDETYIKIKGKWSYLYRAIDAEGHTLDIWLRKQRDNHSAYAFIKRLIKQFGKPQKVITDQAPSTKAAMAKVIKAFKLKPDCHCTSKYLNNLIEQDHRHIKVRKTRYQSINTAKNTLKGIECIYALYKKNRRSLQIYGFSPCHEISIMLAS
ncbi:MULTISPECIES: IS6-like element IS257 family transposase [Staphylococcaceae]|uniref:IS6-like element IS257 family transposase n=1 Tax=Staphylococcaceae TaxID=90964 RepID=UPI001E594F8F|nr:MULTISPECIES: IS6-like element IS257 family transposase [Staphylococcaceae]WJE87794.1 IS6-like element IS257 family transposase [Staphylococcus casei]